MGTALLVYNQRLELFSNDCIFEHEKGLKLSIKFKPHAGNGVDYPNNIIMNKNAKKMYVAPSIKEHVVELEQGIAAASPGGTGTTSSTPSIDDWGNETGSTQNGSL